MKLSDGGIDVFYIDESHDRNVYVVTAVAIPLLRNIDSHWMIVWADYLEAAKAWRKSIFDEFRIPKTKELHGVKLASGRGGYNQGKYNFPKPKASSIYRGILQHLNWLPPESILTASVNRGTAIYGSDRLEGAMHILFQRMRKHCSANKRNAICFFDEGHPEYRKLYRKAQVFLPTGSMHGGWKDGKAANLPLDMFLKDANEKNSKLCFFTQIADMVAYSAFVKRKCELGQASDWQEKYNWHSVYDDVPKHVINQKVSFKPPRDGIVRS